MIMSLVYLSYISSKGSCDYSVLLVLQKTSQTELNAANTGTQCRSKMH